MNEIRWDDDGRERNTEGGEWDEKREVMGIENNKRAQKLDAIRQR